MLKKITIALSIFFGALFLGSLFFDKTVEFYRESTVRANPKTVYTFVRALNDWPQWTFWSQKRYPQMKFACIGNPPVKCDWSGPKSGKGKLSIAVDKPFETLGVNILLNEDFPFLMSYSFRPGPTKNETVVRLKIKLEAGYNIFMRYLLPLMESKMAPDLEYNLKNLARKFETR